MTRRRIMICTALLVLAMAGVTTARIDDEQASGGLKEALQIGSLKAVDILGQLDGYWGNKEVRIPVPEKMERFTKAMSRLGMKDTVEELEVGMNRAAETAAPLAKDVFVETIKDMDIRDALKIVRGKDHEGTDYLRENSGPKLAELFEPIVAQQMESVGAARTFQSLLDRGADLPFVETPAIDLNAYVTEKALDGMFLMIAKEEEKIRKDPLARTSDLLKTVFGGNGDEDKAPWWKRIRKDRD